jgi:TolB-like protein
MMRSDSFRGPIPVMLCAVLACALCVATINAQEATVADKLAEALDYYNELEFEKGLEVAKGLLQRPDLGAQDSVAIYGTMSIITYAKGEQYLKKAFEYLDKISSIGPCIIPLPQDIWPQELRDQWYRVLKAKDALTCEESKSDIKTIAIMPFDNYSAGKYQEKLGLISKGLADFFAYDFSKISSFKVIERDKIDFILDEIKLQQSGAVDRATAVKVGKILGAKYMVFGSITQLDDKHTRMVVRVVSVETSEIVALVDKEGKPDYSKMQKELVADLSEELDVKLNEETLGLLEEGGTDSYDATEYYSMGLEYMDKYDYRQAYEYFKKAYEADSSFVEAKRKMDIYRPLAG